MDLNTKLIINNKKGENPMYGLEKRKKFDFDLEIDLKKNPKEKLKIQDKIKKETEEIKTLLKKKEEGNFEDLGILLNAYDALDKVISKIK